jgi:hypothetical protein
MTILDFRSELAAYTGVAEVDHAGNRERHREVAEVDLRRRSTRSRPWGLPRTHSEPTGVSGHVGTPPESLAPPELDPEAPPEPLAPPVLDPAEPPPASELLGWHEEDAA